METATLANPIALLAEYAGVSLGLATLIIVVLAVWDLAWRGVALWHAARNHQKRWFIAILAINNVVGLVAIAYLLWFRRDKREGVTPSLFNNPVSKESDEEGD